MNLTLRSGQLDKIMLVDSKGYIIYAISSRPKVRPFFSSIFFWGGGMFKKNPQTTGTVSLHRKFFSSYFPTKERRMSWWSAPGLLSPSAICWLSPRICSLFLFILIFIKAIRAHRLGQIKLTFKCKLLPHTLHFPQLYPHPACQRPPHSLWAVSSACLLSFSRGARTYLSSELLISSIINRFHNTEHDFCLLLCPFPSISSL